MPSYASGAAGSLPAEVSVAMSPPAQNDFPTARTTSAPTSGLASTSSNVAISSSAIAGVSALRRSGAFSVTIATPPSTSSSTSPDPVTSPPSCRADRPRRLPDLLTGIRPRAPTSPTTRCGSGEDLRRLHEPAERVHAPQLLRRAHRRVEQQRAQHHDGQRLCPRDSHVQPVEVVEER